MKISIGRFVTTHGIKGEIRIKSNFKYKDRVFKVGNEIIIDKPYIITSYRIHKGFDMVTLEGINDINDIIHLKGSLVYIEKEKYMNDTDYVDNDLIGFDIICNNEVLGKLTEFYYINENKKLLCIDSKKIPYELVKKVDLDKKCIIIEYIEGVIW